MPIIHRMTRDEVDLAREIRDSFGGASILDVDQVRQTLGVKSRNTALKFLDGLVPTRVNGKRRWLVSDVACKILAGRTGALV